MVQSVSRALSALAFAAALSVSAAAHPAFAAAAPASATASRASADITRDEVLAAQRAWGDALVRISTAHETGGAAAARRVAEQVIDTAYGYNLGPVLFKPTLTVAPQTFRTTREGALAYFVGGDPAFASDTGFALKGWRSYQIENAAIFMDDDVAISMGKVRLTDTTGAVTEVDKTWGWKRDADGNLRIVLHHSSLPYQPN